MGGRAQNRNKSRKIKCPLFEVKKPKILIVGSITGLQQAGIVIEPALQTNVCEFLV
jgi:hypothetical protein